jgi:hypothetical protein
MPGYFCARGIVLLAAAALLSFCGCHRVSDSSGVALPEARHALSGGSLRDVDLHVTFFADGRTWSEGRTVPPGPWPLRPRECASRGMHVMVHAHREVRFGDVWKTLSSVCTFHDDRISLAARNQGTSFAGAFTFSMLPPENDYRPYLLLTLTSHKIILNHRTISQDALGTLLARSTSLFPSMPVVVQSASGVSIQDLVDTLDRLAEADVQNVHVLAGDSFAPEMGEVAAILEAELETLDRRIRVAGSRIGEWCVGDSPRELVRLLRRQAAVKARLPEEGRLLEGRRVDEETLWLRFARDPKTETAAASDTPAARTSRIAEPDANWLGGRRVSENSWVYDRQRVLDYYAEMLDNPDRLVNLFDSMRPVYDDDRNITGYRLDIRGEKDFFESVGMREGDIVRRVNSIEMTSRRRVEFFIGEFVADRANAFVFEIERDGEPRKFVYQIR